MNHVFYKICVTLVWISMGQLVGCAQITPKVEWQGQPMPLSQAKNGLVLVMLNEATLRKRYEAEWVLALRKKGIKAGPSYAVMTDIQSLTGESFKPLQTSHQMDTIFVATVSLLPEDAHRPESHFPTFVENQLTLGFDLFLQQMEAVSVVVSAYSLADDYLLWQAVYRVPVQGQGFDWDKVVAGSIERMLQAGLAPLPEETKPAKEQAESKGDA